LGLAAACAAAATKKKKKPLSAASRKVYERAAAAAEKKAVAAEAVAAEAKEGALGADAIGAALADAFWARRRAAEAHARLTAASAPSERHAASGHLGKEAQIDGTVKRVKPSWDDEEALREAKLDLTVEQVALQEMRELELGWVCALWVEGQLHVYLAGDLEGDKRWIKQVLVGEESEKVPVAKERLESQRMVVMKEQKFFFVNTAGFGPFVGVGKGKGKGDGLPDPMRL